MDIERVLYSNCLSIIFDYSGHDIYMIMYVSHSLYRIINDFLSSENTRLLVGARTRPEYERSFCLHCIKNGHVYPFNFIINNKMEQIYFFFQDDYYLSDRSDSIHNGLKEDKIFYNSETDDILQWFNYDILDIIREMLIYSEKLDGIDFQDIVQKILKIRVIKNSGLECNSYYSYDAVKELYTLFNECLIIGTSRDLFGYAKKPNRQLSNADRILCSIMECVYLFNDGNIATHIAMIGTLLNSDISAVRRMIKVQLIQLYFFL